MTNIIEKQIKKFSKNIFLVTEKRKITYDELLLRSEKKLNFINQGELILVVATNTISFFEIYFFSLKNNIPIMLIDENISQKKIEEIINLYKPNYLFLTSKKYVKNLKYESVNFYDFLIFKTSKYKKNINKQLALLLSTSGSTGSSKFVKLSYENIYDNALNIGKYLRINQSHTTITTMPPSYSYGLSIINSHFFQGSKIVVNKLNFFEKNFWKQLNSFKVSSFGGVPFHFKILKKLKFEKMNLKYLKYLTQAGGALNPEEINYFIDTCKKKKIEFIQMYGQTEASPRISYLPFSKAKEKIGSIGKVIPGGKIQLKKRKEQKIGEIIYSGKNVFMGYSFNKNDLGKNVKKKQMLNTGDLAWMDNEGYYYLSGRKTRFAKIAGLRINLDEIKTFLENKKIVSEVIEKEGKIIIFATLNENLKKIINLIFTEYKLNKNFFRVIKIKNFKRNSRGKINLTRLTNHV